MKRGFSLIELLVAIGIIIVLAGLLIPVAGMVRRKARWVDCSNRIENLRRALLGAAGSEQSAANWVLRTTNSGAHGLSWNLNSTDPLLRGTLGVTAGAFFTYQNPWELRFPLGRPSARFDQQNAYTYDNGHSRWDLKLLTEAEPISFGLDDSSAQWTAALILGCEIAPSLAAVTTDRGPHQAWNDPWGNPLLIGTALYQYGPASTASGTRWPWAHGPGERAYPSQDFTDQWKKVHAYYGTSAQAYLAIGAIGPKPDSATPSSMNAATYAAAWSAVLSRCNRADDGSQLWRVDPQATPAVDALATPPWDGLRQ
nr:type II secretion system protein [Planctomycetota bacterium]